MGHATSILCSIFAIGLGFESLLWDRTSKKYLFHLQQGKVASAAS
jgi:hypothetical protein